MKRIDIRIAQRTDIPAICEILNHEILHGTANYNYEAGSLADQYRWFEEKKDASYPIFVAVEGQDILGFATFGKFRPKIGYLKTVEHSIYVKDGSTGLGIGTKLMESLIDCAKADGYHSMLGFVDDSNQGSYDFHRRFDFQEVGHLKEVGYKFDRYLGVYIMQLFLMDN